MTIIGCSSEDDPGLIQSPLKEQTSTKKPTGEETPITDPVAEAPKGPSVKMSNQLKKVGGNQQVADKAVLKALGVKEDNPASQSRQKHCLRQYYQLYSSGRTS